jgi:predicted secreted protein
MAASKGSTWLIKKTAAVICAGVVSKDVKYNGEPIDISSDDSAGWRELM